MGKLVDWSPAGSRGESTHPKQEPQQGKQPEEQQHDEHRGFNDIMRMMKIKDTASLRHVIQAMEEGCERLMAELRRTWKTILNYAYGL